MATGSSKSREHHWWPVGLQKYWADKNGDVWWIEPDERVEKKRARNRKIAKKAHGHTVFKGNVWETNFEGDFQSADDVAPSIVETLISLKPLGTNISEFFKMIPLFFKRDRNLRDMCRFYDLPEDVHRGLLLVLFSLLIRSPGSRFRFESYPELVGLPPNEDVGKGNMRQAYSTAKERCENGLISNQYFVLIHSTYKKFIFGDGHLDWLTGGLLANRIDGRALVPLTPHLCVYLCTPRYMRSTPNCASFSAAPWIVNWINNITQIYSQDRLFFVGKPPVLTEPFRRRQFLEHGRKSDELIDMLDEIAGIRKSDRLISWTSFSQ
ncbi:MULTISPECIES: hypothetical protein [unclassified Mesorhizobium]|uniref:hypothetical protein n=1 Tax=unclassified Mesorhizobium TaxID=325217 RepID=UPI00333780EB